MKRELKIEDLATYLQYGLYCCFTKNVKEENRVQKLISVLNIKEIPCANLIHPLHQVKPILRPLSDLFIKRLSNEKGRLLHIHYISIKIFFDLYIDEETTHEAFWNSLINATIHATLSQSKELLDFLYENHYDVEALFNGGKGLIDIGLAIDINTLKNNES
jgi:hypothetical protein